MAWTYNVAELSTSQLFQVRFMIGDTIANDPLLQDEEINQLITEHGNTRSAAAECCDRISATFARQADYDLGPHSVKASQRSKRYEELAKKLKSKVGLAAPIFTDPQRTIFDIDMMNDPGCSHPSEEVE